LAGEENKAARRMNDSSFIHPSPKAWRYTWADSARKKK
jgi:hypothetical protein